MTKKNLQNITPTVEIVKQKRGRKPKNPLVDTSNKQPQIMSENNIVYSIQETETEINIINDFLNDVQDEDKINDTDEENKILIEPNSQPEQKPGGKKRGRKPKGGKIIQQVVSSNNNKETKNPRSYET